MFDRRSQRARTIIRVLAGIVAAAGICLAVEAIVRRCGWHAESQRAVLNFAYNSILILWLLWALRKRLIKGVIGYLLVFYVLAGLVTFATIGIGLTARFVPDAFATEAGFVIDGCKPRGHEYICSGTTTASPPRSGVVTLNEPHAHGDTVDGTFYGGPFGGFAENSPAPPHPAIFPSLLRASALLAAIVLVIRPLVRAVRTPTDAPLWEPSDSLFTKPQAEAIFRRGGLVGTTVATVVSCYLFMQQLGAASDAEAATILGLSVGDWMTVASAMVGIVAWGYRRVETPFGEKMIAASSKVTLLGLLAVTAIFVVLQSEAIAKHFVVTAWPFVWTAVQYIDGLQRGFNVPMLLASVALLLSAHLMTIQFSETDAAIRHRTSLSSVLIPEAQKVLDFLAPHTSGCDRAEINKRFPDNASCLAELQRIGLLTQVNYKPRLTKNGRRVARPSRQRAVVHRRGV